jgi:hypothetical protein
MGNKAKGTVDTKSWNEQPYSEVAGGPKLAVVNGVDAYHGDIEGEATWAGVIVYHTDGSANFKSIQRVVGAIDGKKGSFVLQINGDVDTTGKNTAKWSVEPGSGTDDLKRITGEGGFVFKQGEENSFHLEYELN